MTLEDTLKRAAYKVWDELEPVNQGRKIKIFEVREEALTTMALKEIIKSSCSEIDTLKMISGSEESLKGYDFELVIGSKSKSKYVRFFVQAKRLFGKSVNSSYDSIHFTQTDDLINYSRRQSSLAMYAFYNHIVADSLTIDNHYNSATHIDKKSLGITIASAYSVKRLKSKKFKEYHFNDGLRIRPLIYDLRHFPHLFYFHKITRKHLAVPFHELSFFTIEMAEQINKLYRRIKNSGKFNLLSLFPFDSDDFSNENGLIPIIKANSEVLTEQFMVRAQEGSNFEQIYNPQFLLIINIDKVE